MQASSLHTRTMGRMACLIALTSIFAGCKKTDDLAGYTKGEADKVSAPVVSNPGFEEGLSGWTAGSGFLSAVGQGTQQTRALYHERTNPAEYALAQQAIALSPSQSYRFSALLRTEGVQAGAGDAHGGATVAL
ncbi:MAG: hypothetical protein ACKOHM_06920, partial [Spartobacteria bacterium]